MLGAAWSLDVTNVTKGWTLSTWEGKADTVLDVGHPLLLQAPFKGTWGWADYPADLEPRQAAIEIRALTAAAFLAGAAVDPGDLIDVDLYHEVAAPPGQKWRWHRVVGYADEPEASQDDRGLVVKVTVVDPLARLAEIAIDDPTPWPAESLGNRISRIANAANINLATMAAFAGAGTMGPVTVNNKGALPLLRECLAGVQVAGQQLVLRATIGTREWPAVLQAAAYDTFYLADTTWVDRPLYVIDVVGRGSAMRAPYVMTAARDLGAPGAAPGVGLRVVTRTPIADLSTVVGGVALSAGDVLRDPTTWVKSRTTAINQIKLVGVDALGEEASVVAQHADLVLRDGPSTRVVQTQRLIDAGSLAVAAALLPDRVTAQARWTADAFTLTTRDLTEAELTTAARELWPGTPEGGLGTVSAAMQVPVAIVGVDTTAALTGGDISGVLEGATVQVDKTGVLTIAGELRAEQLRPTGIKTGIATWAQLKTEPVDNEPAIQWSTFDWKSTAATPWQTNDRIADADQTHPSFGHEQLTWLDARLLRIED